MLITLKSGQTINITQEQKQILDANRSKWSTIKSSIGKNIYPITETSQVMHYIVTEQGRLNREKALQRAEAEIQRKLQIEAQQQMEALTTQVNVVKVANNALSQTVKAQGREINIHESQIASLNEGKDLLQSSLNTQNSRLEILETAINGNKANSIQLDEQLSASKSKIKELESKLAKEQQKNLQLETNMASLEKDFQTQNKELMEKVASQLKQLEENLQNERTLMNGRNEQLSQTIQGVDQQLGTVSDLETEHHREASIQFTQLEQQINDLKEKLSKLQIQTKLNKNM